MAYVYEHAICFLDRPLGYLVKNKLHALGIKSPGVIFLGKCEIMINERKHPLKLTELAQWLLHHEQKS